MESRALASARSQTRLHGDRSEGPSVGTWPVWHEETEKVLWMVFFYSSEKNEVPLWARMGVEEVKGRKCREQLSAGLPTSFPLLFGFCWKHDFKVQSISSFRVVFSGNV